MSKGYMIIIHWFVYDYFITCWEGYILWGDDNNSNYWNWGMIVWLMHDDLLI